MNKIQKEKIKKIKNTIDQRVLHIKYSILLNDILPRLENGVNEILDANVETMRDVFIVRYIHDFYVDEKILKLLDKNFKTKIALFKYIEKRFQKEYLFMRL